MLIGYMRVSKADGSQVLDLQRDALIAAGADPFLLYEDSASGKRDNRPGLEACLKSLRPGDTLVAWRLDRLGRDLRHLINLAHKLRGRHGGRPFKMTPAKLRLAQAAVGRREMGVSELCTELGITRQTLYRHVDPHGRLRPDGEKLLRHRHTGREQRAAPVASDEMEARERHG